MASCPEVVTEQNRVKALCRFVRIYLQEFST